MGAGHALLGDGPEDRQREPALRQRGVEGAETDAGFHGDVTPVFVHFENAVEPVDRQQYAVGADDVCSRSVPLRIPLTRLSFAAAWRVGPVSRWAAAQERS